jgi:hypothetical protein
MLTTNGSVRRRDAEPARFPWIDGNMSAVTKAPSVGGPMEGIVESATYSSLFGLARIHRLIDKENVYEFVLV